MAGTNELRHRIAAVEQTMKITGAMEMVSSNRMRRVMAHIEYNKKYYSYIRQAMHNILESAKEADDVSMHPYLTVRENPRRTVVVISGDKGLCGSYNSLVLRLAEEVLREVPDSSLITVGNVAEDYFRRLGRTPDITMLGIVQDPTMKSARRVTHDLMQLYENNLTDEIVIVHTAFYGATKGRPVQLRLLPIRLEDYDEESELGDSRYYEPGGVSEMEYLPDRKSVFDRLVPQFLIGLVFGVMVQAYAGEHYARMNAMHASTDNAGDMLKGLQLQYNLARQSAITNEIAEITGAAEILQSKSRPMNIP
ncbi:MAG: ATP synthase F1 subunit gamma [Oscillospiraceae bacterium]|jgi:F-type H+-transporting ATPase subunit gamma|nr:ATP synthase F1 subunit gamma [Oscillospiraceae bacterium]